MPPIHQTYSPFGKEFILSVAADIKDTVMVEYWQKSSRERWYQCQIKQTVKYPRWKITVLADMTSTFLVSHQIGIFQTFQTDPVRLCHLRHSRGSILCKFVLKPLFFPRGVNQSPPCWEWLWSVDVISSTTLIKVDSICCTGVKHQEELLRLVAQVRSIRWEWSGDALIRQRCYKATTCTTFNPFLTFTLR